MSTVDGLPAHVLLVHAVVVLVPLSSLLLLINAAWPAARARLAWPGAVLAVVSLAAVPLTTEAGEWLEHHLPRSPLVAAHTHLGDTLLPWAIGLAVLAVALAVVHTVSTRRARTSTGGRVALTVVLVVLALVVGGGASLATYRIGESGSRAAWTGRVAATAPAPPRVAPVVGS